MQKQDFSQLATDESISKAKNALEQNGIEVFVAENSDEGKKKVLELIPQGVEVMNMTSQTLEAMGIAKEIVESGRYNSVRKKFATMDRKTQGLEMQKLGAAPEFVVGSVQAVTEDGKIVLASQTGSQLPAYAYGSQNVIWVVGAEKIVKDLEIALKRLYEYVLPLEDQRAKKAYGTGSAVNKLLIVSKEVQKGRIKMVIVKENLGF